MNAPRSRTPRRGRPRTTPTDNASAAAPPARKNTETAYYSCLRHYIEVYGRTLPATADDIVHYLLTYQRLLSRSTLSQRLWAFSRYHRERRFTDPTTDPRVAATLRGISERLPRVVKHARPLTRQDLEQTVLCLDQETQAAASSLQLYRPLRDRALLLIGFWLGLRAHHLAALAVDTIQVDTLANGRRLTLSVPDTEAAGEYLGPWYLYEMPALCPVTAYLGWVNHARLTQGPLFRRIDAGQNLHDGQLHPGSINGILRSMLRRAGLPDNEYSSHSLRRGLATSWVEIGGNIDALVDVLQWKSIHSAIPYRIPITSLQQALLKRWENDRPISQTNAPSILSK